MDSVTKMKLSWTVLDHIMSVTCEACNNYFFILKAIVTPEGHHPIQFCPFCGARRKD